MCWFKKIESYELPKAWTSQKKLTDWPCEEIPKKPVREGSCFWGMKKIVDYIVESELVH